MLTGKAKEQFEKWFDKNHGGFEHPLQLPLITVSIKFKDLPDSMQWGVIQDFADSLGYEIYAVRSYGKDCVWAVQYKGTTWSNRLGTATYKTDRQEARNAAIEKLNEIINEQ